MPKKQLQKSKKIKKPSKKDSVHKLSKSIPSGIDAILSQITDFRNCKLDDYYEAMIEYGKGGYGEYQEYSEVVQAFRSLYTNINENLIPSIPKGFVSPKALLEWIVAFRDYADQKEQFAKKLLDKYESHPLPFSHLFEIVRECRHFAEHILSLEYSKATLGLTTTVAPAIGLRAKFPTPENSIWKDVVLTFEANETVQIKVKDVTRTYHYAELGLLDKRTYGKKQPPKASKLCVLLKATARFHQGVTLDDWRAILHENGRRDSGLMNKDFDLIGDLLFEVLGIAGNPFEAYKSVVSGEETLRKIKDSYQPKFQILDRSESSHEEIRKDATEAERLKWTQDSEKIKKERNWK